MQPERLAEDEVARVVRQVETAGDRLVDALRDQLADGQTEHLYTLQSAAAELRRSGSALTEAGVAIGASADAAAVRLTGAAESLASAASAATDRASNELASRLGQLADGLGTVASADLERLAEALRTRLDVEAETIGGRVAGAVEVGIHAMREESVRLHAQAESLPTALAHYGDAFAQYLSGVVADAELALQEESSALRRAATSVQAQLTADAEAISRRLRDDAAASSQQVLTHLRITEESVATIAQRSEDAKDSLGWVAQEIEARLETATGTLERHAVESVAALTSAGNRLTEQVRSAGDNAVERLEEAVAAAATTLDEAALDTDERVARARHELATFAVTAVDGIADAGRALVADAQTRAALLAESSQQFLDALHSQLRAQQKRDSVAAARGEDRIAQLAARVEASLVAATVALSAETARAEARDEELERRRADEFVRVLDDVLSRGGVRPRGLLDRVRRGIDASPRHQEVEAPAPPPAASLPSPQPVDKPVLAKRSAAKRVPVDVPSVAVAASPKAARPRRTPQSRQQEESS